MFARLENGMITQTLSAALLCSAGMTYLKQRPIRAQLGRRLLTASDEKTAEACEHPRLPPADAAHGVDPKTIYKDFSLDQLETERTTCFKNWMRVRRSMDRNSEGGFLSQRPEDIRGRREYLQYEKALAAVDELLEKKREIPSQSKMTHTLFLYISEKTALVKMQKKLEKSISSNTLKENPKTKEEIVQVERDLIEKQRQINDVNKKIREADKKLGKKKIRADRKRVKNMVAHSSSPPEPQIGARIILTVTTVANYSYGTRKMEIRIEEEDLIERTLSALYTKCMSEWLNRSHESDERPTDNIIDQKTFVDKLKIHFNDPDGKEIIRDFDPQGSKTWKAYHEDEKETMRLTMIEFRRRCGLSGRVIEISIDLSDEFKQVMDRELFA